MDGKQKIPHGMQALIALIILLDFTGLLFGPSLIAGWKNPSDALTQTLFALVMLAVGFYLGSSSSSARKDDQAAQQSANVIAALAPMATAPTLPNGTPIVHEDTKPASAAVV